MAILVLTAPATHAQYRVGDFTKGSITLGYDGRMCDGSLEGAIRYNSAGSACIELCDGNEWAPADGGPGGCTAPSLCPDVGDVCSDGTVYAGLSPDGNLPMYTTPADAGLYPWNDGNTSGFTTTNQTSETTGESNTNNLITIDSDGGAGGTQPHQAAQYCADLDAHGHTDWYLPAKDELNVLYLNLAAISGFNTSGSLPDGYYWSSSEIGNNPAFRQRFSTGAQDDKFKDNAYSIRCVRRD